jgi:hypothetical protein
MQGDENMNPYPIFHKITMDKQSKLIVKCKNLIAIKSNIMCNHFLLFWLPSIPLGE